MTYQLQLTGIVQGVGFRPMVYATATQLHIAGTVSNSSAGVNIIFNADDDLANLFHQSVLQNLPANSKVTDHHLKRVDDCVFNSFDIIESSSESETSVLLAPDFAMCESCRIEMKDPETKRYQYAFITCTQCGPRYSIINQLPYDRIHTTMESFRMCQDCQTEYSNPLDRRYYSQTNSCETCGVTMTLHTPQGEIAEGNEAIYSLLKLIQEGKTVAVKGIGGFLLLCDATNSDAIRKLRKLKHRPTKPFALLYPNKFTLEGDVELSSSAINALKSPAAPIVLVPMKQNLQSGIQESLIAPGLHSLGVMLPYAPLLERIASGLENPLIATSANISNSPIVYTNEAALHSLFAVADAVLLHDRDIAIPQDDSVIRFSKHDRRIIIRRSRGLAPTYFNSIQFPKQEVLAMGAQLKSTATLLHHSNVYISQYIGDLESADTEQSYKDVFHHLINITGAKPALILSDSHPDYASTRIGNSFAASQKLPVEYIQHHRAHFAAVLAENNLQDVTEAILGVIWDGTGLGGDGKIWGGEFFIWDGTDMNRVEHLSYFPLLFGDKMAREPRLAALAVTSEVHHSLLSSKFTEHEWKVYSTAIKSETTKTSSMGRVFDAVASWCGLCDKASYEGEAALLLEEAATQFFQTREDYFVTYPLKQFNDQIDTMALVNEIIHDVLAGTDPSEVAARFHCTLVKLIQDVAAANQIQSLAFSGGVFQNALLVSLLEKYLSHDFKLYFHEQLSPNDECISFGQLAYWGMMNRHGNRKYTEHYIEDSMINV